MSDHSKKLTLPPPVMQPSESTNTLRFRNNYDALLKEVLEESSEDEDDFLPQHDIDVNAATADLPEDLRAALEDRALASKYLATLKDYMNHRRSQSISSINSGKGDYSIPNTPLQASFNLPQSPKPFERVQPDPLSKVLDAVPYQTRLINGVPSLTLLEQKFHALRIPELELPVVSDTLIHTRLDGLYKIRDDLYIHLNGGPLVKVTTSIGDKKKQKVSALLEDVSAEIGLYEEFVKKANYLSLENILNESDSSDIEDFPDSLEGDSNHFDSASDMSKTSPGTPSYVSSPKRIASQLSIASNNYLDSSAGDSSLSRPSSDYNQSPNLVIDGDNLIRTVSREEVEPWEAFKWTPLVKISDQLHSDAIKQESGLISVMTVSGVIAIGTTRSLVFVYDYSQNLKCILGDSTRAVELGSVTSLAVSADHTTIACGHSQGYIVVWDIRKPANPILTIKPISASQVVGALMTPQYQVSRMEGHVKGTTILHVGFVGVKKTDIVSGDDQGMACYHVLKKVIMMHGVSTTRLLGRYQNLSLIPEIQRAQAQSRQNSPTILPKPRTPSTVFAMQPLPLGQIPHPAENFGLVALLTPYKMIIVGVKPSPQTLYKFLKPKPAQTSPDARENADDAKASIEGLSGCLAWLPVTKTGQETSVKAKDSPPPTDPMLAFVWGNHLFILRVGVENQPDKKNSNKKGVQLQFVKMGEWKCRDSIVGIQWINRQILVLFTANEEMILFDPKKMTQTHHTSIRTKQLVYHDWFNTPLKDLVQANPTSHILKTVEMAYGGSIKGYKGKIFLLGLNQIYVGTLLSWADRILALVQAGDFLESIELATSFYNGIGIQTVIGLPEEKGARKALVGEKLMDLLTASLNYTFSANRTYSGMINDVSGGETVLFQNLAQGCVQACLSMDKLEFLFETVYERFAENDVKGIFLEVLVPCIVEDRVPDVPPEIMKDLVDHYSKKRLLDSLEQVIWHVNPRSLDIDQIVSMCHRDGLYEAMMYVWNASMGDYVSPVVEMLKVIRTVLRNDNDPSRQNAEKLFDYLKLILTGRSFPDGAVIPSSEEASEIRSAVYSFVFSGRCVVWPPVGGKLILTADDEEGVSEPTYPYLRLLLRFNTKKLLNTLEVAFEDPWLNGGEDILSSKFEDEVPGKVISRQIIVNTLLDVMGGGLTGTGLPPPRPKQSISASTVQSFSTNSRPTLHINVPTYDTAATYDYISNENVILLYMFIALNLHKYTTFILLPPKTLHKVLVRLASDHDPDTREDRQQAVQNLLTVYTPSNEEYIVGLYEEAGFWQVLEQVYRRDKKYGKLVETYLKDDARRDMVFECVETLLGHPDLTERQKDEIKRVFTIRISQFVEVDGQQAAHLVQHYFHGDHADMIKRLEEDKEFDDDDHHTDKRVFSYLRGLLEPSSTEPTENFTPGLMIEPTVPKVDAAIQERYIELMCRFDPSGVFNYFNTKLHQNIDLDKVQAWCEEYGVMDAVVWIMESRGDTQGALEKMLDVAKEKNTTILALLNQHQSDTVPWRFEEEATINSCLIGLNGVLRVGTRLCEGNSRVTHLNDDLELSNESGSLPELSKEGSSTGGEEEDESIHMEEVLEDSKNDQVETLWFRLLDVYVEASIEMHNAIGESKSAIHQRVISSFKQFVQSILTSLLLSTSPQVSLPRLLLRLIYSQARGETTFADFRDIFLSMLDTYKYEGKLLEMTNRLFDRDLFHSMKDVVDKRAKGWRPRRAACEICDANILDLSLLQPALAWGVDDEQEEEPQQSKRYVLFHCGHGFHTDCLNRQVGMQVCIVCQQDTPSRKGKEKATHV